ncbi:MAG: hypothetical protein HND44_02285 [Chloroflexi bacterium]|nr:hypothetical protein [Ardenticatenaceae bacterium]MBL1127327.1 hypothetical protein [Chloroflexota bacterium]NOG33388.1 hypothetical protein [Chloroflexota bacterium]GIK57209.1 MAG: hypothetical protein BroJett015_28720 [Chloroflexota bacterium]
MSKKENDDMGMDILSETENFAVWRSPDEDGFLYHIELGSITLHLAADEYEELILLLSGTSE